MYACVGAIKSLISLCSSINPSSVLSAGEEKVAGSADLSTPELVLDLVVSEAVPALIALNSDDLLPDLSRPAVNCSSNARSAT